MIWDYLTTRINSYVFSVLGSEARNSLDQTDMPGWQSLFPKYLVDVIKPELAIASDKVNSKWDSPKEAHMKFSNVPSSITTDSSLHGENFDSNERLHGPFSVSKMFLFFLFL